jgi:hypothetical protein
MAQIQENLASFKGRNSGIRALGFDKNGHFVLLMIGRLL